MPTDEITPSPCADDPGQRARSRLIIAVDVTHDGDPHVLVQHLGVEAVALLGRWGHHAEGFSADAEVLRPGSPASQDRPAIGRPSSPPASRRANHPSLTRPRTPPREAMRPGIWAPRLGPSSSGVGSGASGNGPRRVVAMSVYKVIDIIGTSTASWEDAASAAVVKARESLRDLRVAEVVKQDLDVGADGSLTYRIKLSVSFKYEDS